MNMIMNNISVGSKVIKKPLLRYENAQYLKVPCLWLAPFLVDLYYALINNIYVCMYIC